MGRLFRSVAVYVALFLGATLSYAQTAYIELAVAPGVSFFRDMATSPLFYKGNTISFLGAWHLTKRSNEKMASAVYTFGTHSNNYNSTSNSARFYNIEFNFSQLYQINKLSNNKWRTKIGGGVVSTLNIRENKALMNNSLGIENISNVIFCSKISRDFFRLKHRELSLLFNLGVLNMNYRPGYAYNYMPSIGGSNVRSMTDHHFSINGFRLNSSIQYSKHLSNKNILRVAYIFDAYNAPGKYEPFNYAKHSLKFSLLFNYK